MDVLIWKLYAWFFKPIFEKKYFKKDVTYFFKRPRMVECVSTGRDKDVQQKTGQINSPLQGSSRL